MTYTLNGGPSYMGGVDIETDSLESAGYQWYLRYVSNGQFKVDGCLYPVFGSGVDLHDYAVINYETEETLTRKQIMEMVND